MARFQTFVFGLSRLAALVACLLLAGMVGLILYEIVLRSAFSTSTFVLSEFVGYAVSACTFLSLGYALEHGSLVRVNSFLAMLRGGYLRAAEFLCAALALIVVSVMIWFFWLRVIRHWTRGTVSSSIAQVPMWIPEGAVLLGLAVFWLQLVAYALAPGRRQRAAGSSRRRFLHLSGQADGSHPSPVLSSFSSSCSISASASGCLPG
jgi:TRAP-type C4-dicarboxylate transport system permease small subunit